MKHLIIIFLLAASFCFAQTYEQAKKLFGEGKYEEAINQLDRVIEQDPSSKNAYVLRGTSYDYIGQYDQAIADYTRAIEIDPEFVAAYNNRGSVYITLEQYEKGLPDLDKALELNSKNANSYYNRAIIHTFLAKPAEVISDGHAYLDVEACKDPRGQDVIIMTLFAYRELGKFEEGNNFLESTSAQCNAEVWPYPVLRYLKGEITAEDVETQTKNEQQKADAKTFVLYNQFQDKNLNTPETNKELQQIVDLNYRDSISYILAKKLLHTFEPIVPSQP
ncbi:tetratricopeptide repeat protein [bacterium]|nr:tetratricopeptide repeat protein [bacterium]MCI0605602.1 tetratricopeptide repeat protein [bacterium]